MHIIIVYVNNCKVVSITACTYAKALEYLF